MLNQLVSFFGQQEIQLGVCFGGGRRRVARKHLSHVETQRSTEPGQRGVP